MSSSIDALVNREYQYGFTTDIEADTLPPGLSEDTVRFISAKKQEPEWLLEWRLKAFRRWLTMKEPHWANVVYPPIDYQAASYYSAPKSTKPLGSLDDVDPVLLDTYKKLGISLNEQKRLNNVAVDAVFDSVSVGTTYKEELSKYGIVFMSFGEAVDDSRFVVRYFRKSTDGRLLFGGREIYAVNDPKDIHIHIRRQITEIYPALKDVEITHGWGGYVGITVPRKPFVREVMPNVISAGGYSGHGVMLSNFMGKLYAETVAGNRDRLKLFEELNIPAFPGGSRFRSALLFLALNWYALRDRI